MASRYELFDRMQPDSLTSCIEYDIMLQEIASSDIVECFFSYDSFQRQLTVSLSSDWNKLRDIIKYKIEHVVTHPCIQKFVF
jgi:hypothetical protein